MLKAARMIHWRNHGIGCLILSLVGFSSLARSAFAFDPAEVIARVGDREITLAEYQKFIRHSHVRLSWMQPDLPSHRDLAEEYAVDLVLAASAEKEATRFEALRTVRWELWKLETSEGWTRLLEEVFVPKQGPSEESIQSFYKDRLEAFKSEPRFSFRHVFFDTTQVEDPAEKEKIRSEAEAFLDKVTDGKGKGASAPVERFVAAAEEATGKPRTNFEVRGPFAHGKIMDEIERAALALEPGQVSEVVETKHGCQVVRLEMNTVGGTKPLSEVRSQIREILTDGEMQRREDEFGKKITQSGRLLVFDDGLADLVRWATNPHEVGNTLLGKAGDSEVGVLDYLDFLAFESPGKVPKKRIPAEEIRKTHRKNVRDSLLIPVAFLQEARAIGLTEDATYQSRYRIGRSDILGRKQFDRLVERRVGALPPISEEEAMYFFRGHEKDFSTLERCRFKEVAVGIGDPSSPAERELSFRKAEETAADLLDTIEAGESEEEIVRKYSVGLEAQEGGVTNWIDRLSRYPRGVWDDLSALSVGDWAPKPYRVRNNVLLIKVEDRIPATLRSFDECRGSVEAAIAKEREESVRKELRKELVKQYNITINEGMLSGLEPLIERFR